MPKTGVYLDDELADRIESLRRAYPERYPDTHDRVPTASTVVRDLLRAGLEVEAVAADHDAPAPGSRERRHWVRQWFRDAESFRDSR